MTDKTQIRNAATLILLRREGDQTRILMGQRGRGAAFMPSKFVFPGGALDAGDHALAAEFSASAEDRDALVRSSARNVEPSALALAAIRETWEETGLLLGSPDPRAKDLAAKAPAEWRGFFEKGLIPATEHLRFIFRAVTRRAGRGALTRASSSPKARSFMVTLTSSPKVTASWRI